MGRQHVESHLVSWVFQYPFIPSCPGLSCHAVSLHESFHPLSYHHVLTLSCHLIPSRGRPPMYHQGVSCVDGLIAPIWLPHICHPQQAWCPPKIPGWNRPLLDVPLLNSVVGTCPASTPPGWQASALPSPSTRCTPLLNLPLYRPCPNATRHLPTRSPPARTELARTELASTRCTLVLSARPQRTGRSPASTERK